MEQKKVKVRIPVAKEEDRQTLAGILVKNMIPVSPARDYYTTAAGKKSTAMQYYLIIEAEVQDDKDL
ncbi:MAG: hypothetical protein IKN04_11205 [Clostridia bacterium]|nr:hypothetical protein [Clostridia bacterium]